ncbi:MAG TPA: hypothetical protein VKV15_07140 [Bryobacteraceae bacterium]|nr:hypothetical protein [Bryobacteraceae bacterium]
MNDYAQARGLKAIEVFHEQGESQRLKLFPSHIEPPPDDPQAARAAEQSATGEDGAVRLLLAGNGTVEALGLDRFFEQTVEHGTMCPGR